MCVCVCVWRSLTHNNTLWHLSYESVSNCQIVNHWFNGTCHELTPIDMNEQIWDGPSRIYRLSGAIAGRNCRPFFRMITKITDFFFGKMGFFNKPCWLAVQISSYPTGQMIRNWQCGYCLLSNIHVCICHHQARYRINWIQLTSKFLILGGFWHDSDLDNFQSN